MKIISFTFRSKNIYLFLSIVGLLFLFACSKSSSGTSSEPDNPIVKSPPGSFNLVSPTNNFEATSSQVNFSWSSSLNANSYQLLIKSGEVIVHNQSYTATSASVFLTLGQNYTWQVTASNSDGELASALQTFSIMEAAVEAVVTVIQQAPYFEIIFDEATRTIYPSVPLGFEREDLSFMLEVFKQICSSCEREQIDIRPVSTLAELQQAIPVVRSTVFYVTLTASKLPPGEAQVSFTKAFYPLFRD